MISDDFDVFVKKAMHERKEKHISKKSIGMNIKPEFFQLFRGAQTTWSIVIKFYKLENSGKFYHHIKSSKDRRKNKIDAKNEENEIEKQRTINEFKERFKFSKKNWMLWKNLKRSTRNIETNLTNFIRKD